MGPFRKIRRREAPGATVLIPRSTWARRTDPHGDVPSRRPGVTRMGYDSALPGPSTDRYPGHVAGSLKRPMGWRQYAIPVRRPIPTIHCDQTLKTVCITFSYVIDHQFVATKCIGDSTLYLACRPKRQQIVLSNNTCIVPACFVKCCNGCATVLLNLTDH